MAGLSTASGIVGRGSGGGGEWGGVGVRVNRASGEAVGY